MPALLLIILLTLFISAGVLVAVARMIARYGSAPGAWPLLVTAGRGRLVHPLCPGALRP